MTGRAWRFEGTLDVDWELCPQDDAKQFGKNTTPRLTYAQRLEGLKTLAMKPLDPDFHRKVARGDFLIGGDSTGYGHDHEHACLALRGAGIAAVLCEGTNVNFRRNSIHNGLAVVTVKGIMAAVATGDTLEINLVEGWVHNVTQNVRLQFKPWPGSILEIVRSGGLYPWLRKSA
jgi:3-isopropylmalate/(R)-2-methylmalate dehydratase small subunit